MERKKLTLAKRTYIYIIRHLRVKVQVKILERNLKQGSFITSWFIVHSKTKMISIGSIFTSKFSFINSFFNFREKTGNFTVQVCCQNYASVYSKSKGKGFWRETEKLFCFFVSCKVKMISIESIFSKKFRFISPCSFKRKEL